MRIHNAESWLRRVFLIFFLFFFVNYLCLFIFRSALEFDLLGICNAFFVYTSEFATVRK